MRLLHRDIFYLQIHRFFEKWIIDGCKVDDFSPESDANISAIKYQWTRVVIDEIKTTVQENEKAAVFSNLSAVDGGGGEIFVEAVITYNHIPSEQQATEEAEERRVLLLSNNVWGVSLINERVFLGCLMTYL